MSYMSDYNGDTHTIDTDLQAIVSAAKRNNPKLGITGVLFYHNGKFIQVIEGEEPGLRHLMTLLHQDTRHRNITVLIDEPVEKRGFADWNMDSFNLSNQDSLDVTTMEKVRDAYKANLIPRSNTLVETYKFLLKSGIFRE